MTAILTNDECYKLFLTLDSCARMFEGKNERVNAQREYFLPFYRDWHAAHPHEVHPSCYEKP